MKNVESWSESKYVLKAGKLKASSKNSEVGASSKLMANLIARFYQDSVNKFAKGRLLDLGCGKVPLYTVYKDKASEITCVDWPNSMHDSNNHLDLEHDLNLPIPLPDNNYDTIIFSDVLEHIKNPKDLMSEIARLLDKDGMLLMNVPYYYWLHEEPFDYYRYTEFALRSFLEENDLEEIEIRPIGGAFEVITDIHSKLLTGIPLVGKPFVKFIQSCALGFHSSGIGQKVYRKTARKFPLGYFVIAKRSRL